VHRLLAYRFGEPEGFGRHRERPGQRGRPVGMHQQERAARQRSGDRAEDDEPGRVRAGPRCTRARDDVPSPRPIRRGRGGEAASGRPWRPLWYPDYSRRGGARTRRRVRMREPELAARGFPADERDGETTIGAARAARHAVPLPGRPLAVSPSGREPSPPPGERGRARATMCWRTLCVGALRPQSSMLRPRAGVSVGADLGRADAAVAGTPARPPIPAGSAGSPAPTTAARSPVLPRPSVATLSSSPPVHSCAIERCPLIAM
jgi:hypothetical protein